MKSKNLKKLALLGLTSGVLMSSDASATTSSPKGVEAQLLAHSCGGDGKGCGNNPSNPGKSCANKAAGSSTRSCGAKPSNYYADNGTADVKMNVNANVMSDDQAMKALDPLDRDVYKSMNDKQKALVRKVMSK